MREHNYDIQYVKGKDNFVADHLSRPVRVIIRSPEATWLGLDRENFQARQKENSLWEELTEYVKGGKLPTKRLPKTTLDQFALEDGLLYFMREKTDSSLHYSLIVPRSLNNSTIQHAHELSDHFDQKKTIKKAQELDYWPNLKVDVCKYCKYVKECVTC